MPKVFEGILRAFVALLATAVIATSFLVVVEWLKFCTDQVDDLSMRYTGLPAKVSRVSATAEAFAQSGVVLVLLVVFSVLIVYFIHKPRR